MRVKHHLNMLRLTDNFRQRNLIRRGGPGVHKTTQNMLAGSEILWITNGVAAASGNPFASLAVFDDLVVTARCTKAYKELTVELEDGPFIYCAEQLKPDVISVTDEDGNSYGPGDYTVEYGENTDAGEDAGSVTVKLTLPRSGEVTETFDIQPRALDAYPEATVTVTGSHIHSKESAGITVEIDGRTLTEGTDYEVTIWQDDPSIPVRYAQIDGRGNYTGTTFSDDFYWLDTVEHDDGTYYADYDPDEKIDGKVPVVLFDVDTDVEARDGKYVVPADFTEGSTQYTVVGIAGLWCITLLFRDTDAH